MTKIRQVSRKTMALIEKIEKTREAIKKPEGKVLKNSPKFNNYSSRTYGEFCSNAAIFKIFSDFFNILYQNKSKQKRYKVKVSALYSGLCFNDSVNLYSSPGIKTVFFEYENITFSASFDVYRERNEMHYMIYLCSKEISKLNCVHVYDYLLSCALKESDLKEKYIILNEHEIHWRINTLENRSFGDIFLPETLFDDLVLYKRVFEDNGELFRYLLVGIPGTGKTEATLVLANELNKMGVTIIKTKIGEVLKFNMELAEILAPSIVILDDIDLMLGSRNAGNATRYLSDFLDVLDGTNKLSKNVGILATTNSANLLDLAAQRPGRFDKILLFDEIEKNNIVNIILKSLKYNFNINDKNVIVPEIINNKIVDLFYNSSVTGSHIYNSINILLKKYISLNNIKNIKTNWIITELNNELKTFEKITTYKNITSKFEEKKSKKLGFQLDEQDECVKETAQFDRRVEPVLEPHEVSEWDRKHRDKDNSGRD